MKTKVKNLSKNPIFVSDRIVPPESVRVLNISEQQAKDNNLVVLGNNVEKVDDNSCQFCGKSFKSPAGLASHIRFKHPKESESDE